MTKNPKIGVAKSREVSKSVEHPANEMRRKNKPSIRKKKKKSPEILHDFKKDMKNIKKQRRNTGRKR